MIETHENWISSAVLALILIAAGFGCKSGPSGKPQGTAGGSSGSAVDAVQFQFGWELPTRLTAKSTRRVRKTGGKQKTYRSSYEMSAAKQDGDVRVQIEPNFEGVSGSDPAKGIASVLGAASSVAMPSMLVSADGTFKGVEGLKGTRKAYLDAAKQAAGGSLPKQIGAVLNRYLTEKFLKSRARQHWEMLVGLWTGEQDFEVGKMYESTTKDRFQFPLVGFREVEMELTFGVEERVSCSDGSTETGCVRAAIESRPDVRKMKELMQKWVDEFSKVQAKRQGMAKPPKITVNEVYVKTDVSILTNPSTLRPHRFEEKRTVRLKLKNPNGDVRSIKSVDKRTTTFSE